MKIKISTKFRVALGQVGLLTSLLLLAMLFGLIPDRQTAIRHGRAVLAEAIVVRTTPFITPPDVQSLKDTLAVFVERNGDLQSACVRRQDNVTVVSIGDHQEYWQPMFGEFSSDSQVCVPICSGDQRWGQMELRFTPPNQFMGMNAAQSQIIPLLLFITLTSFVVFYMYLGKMLKHLDPTSVIPPRVRAALDTLTEGLLVIDLKGQIVLANSSFAEIVGMDFDSLLGRNAQDFLWESSSDLPLLRDKAPWTLCLQSGDVQRNSEVRLVDHEGVHRTFSVNCTPVMAAGSKHGGALVSLDDVTQLEEKKKELGEAKDAAVAANQAKSEFLANMSHEIRTPMNAILGFTDVLRRGFGSQVDARKHLNTIHSSGKHLLELINDILDLSKVESGHLEVENISCSPHLVVRDVVQVLAVKANEKGISLSFEADGILPESIYSDPSRLRQIVTNLVGNAIKFTEEGGVSVILSLLEGDKPKLRIDVKDSGIGMTQEHMDRIFDPFAQADSSVTRRFGGTGLGLTISRKFAEALEGTITVKSELGQGTVFSLIVDTGPLEGIAQIHPDKIRRSEENFKQRQTRWQFSSKRVLVVDDGHENRELVKLVLEEVKIDVETAENGKIGAELALEQPFDLILMDMQMPVMDGYAATRLIRENGITIPIFALTAHAMKGFEQGCRDAGCSGFLTKPIDIDVLLERIGEVLDGKQVEDMNSAQYSAMPSIPSDSSPILSSLPMDVPEFSAIVHSFGTRLDEVIQGMIDAMSEQDFGKLAELAHWLKGSGGTVGFGVFTEPAARLENSAERKDLDRLSSTLAEIRDLSRRIHIPNEVFGPAHSDENADSNTNDDKETTIISIPDLSQHSQKEIHLYCKLQAMIDAWQQNELSKVAELAHFLVDAETTIGSPELTVQARQLAESASAHQNNEVESSLNELCRLAARIQIFDALE